MSEEDFEKAFNDWYDKNYLRLDYTACENGIVYFQKSDLKLVFIDAWKKGYSDCVKGNACPKEC